MAANWKLGWKWSRKALKRVWKWFSFYSIRLFSIEKFSKQDSFYASSEHVVNADAKAEERQDGVEGGDLKAHRRTHTKADQKSKEHSKESSQGEVDFQPSPTDRTQDKDSVESHQEVSSSHKAGVKENCLSWEVACALLCIHKNPAKVEL